MSESNTVGTAGLLDALNGGLINLGSQQTQLLHGACVDCGSLLGSGTGTARTCASKDNFSSTLAKTSPIVQHGKNYTLRALSAGITVPEVQAQAGTGKTSHADHTLARGGTGEGSPGNAGLCLAVARMVEAPSNIGTNGTGRAGPTDLQYHGRFNLSALGFKKSTRLWAGYMGQEKGLRSSKKANLHCPHQ